MLEEKVLTKKKLRETNASLSTLIHEKGFLATVYHTSGAKNS